MNTGRGARGRPGMTLVELLVGMVIAGLVLQGVIGFFVSQTRLVGENESRRGAREAARAAMHVFLADLRRVEATGGVTDATPSTVEVRIPFALGLVCTSNIIGTTITLVPTDSMQYANATLSGYAWRGSTGDYTYVTPATTSPGVASDCTGAGLKVFPGGGVLSLNPTAGAIATIGTPVLLYEVVRYEFATAPGGRQLVRTLSGQPPEVLVETFHGDTRFRFFTAGSSTPVDAPPADLGEIRGLQLDLEGLGDRPRPGSGTVATAALSVSVFFKNRPAI